MISIETFNSDQPKADLINSPRSVEACKKLGINPQELVYKHFDQIKVQGMDPKKIELQWAHLENKRKEKISLVANERRNLIEMEQNGHLVIENNKVKYIKQSSKQSKSIQNSKSNGLSLIEKEKLQLEKIKFKQQKEIQQIMDYEMKTQEIKRANEEKLKQQHEKDLQRQKELEQK